MKTRCERKLQCCKRISVYVDGLRYCAIAVVVLMQSVLQCEMQSFTMHKQMVYLTLYQRKKLVRKQCSKVITI